MIYGVFTVYLDPDAHECLAFCGVSATRAGAEKLADKASDRIMGTIAADNDYLNEQWRKMNRNECILTTPYFRRQPGEDYIQKHKTCGACVVPDCYSCTNPEHNWYTITRIVEIQLDTIIDVV